MIESLRRAGPRLLAAAAAIALGLSGARLAAQAAASPGTQAAASSGTQSAASGSSASSDDDSLFGSETVTQSQAPASGSPEKSFTKYDQVKVGGQIKGSFEWSPTWRPAWDGSASLFSPTSDNITPDLETRVTITAKPLADFGVNAQFRSSWPFTTTYTASGDSITVPNISVWSFYSKFNWQDKVYFSFGKQPLAWGVSKGAFQPADDIFAVSSSIDLTDTSQEREGPISLKTTVPLSNTDNFYFLAGVPTPTDGSTTIDPKDLRLGVKAEAGTGNTELGAAAYYCYNDHPRALLMGTTGNGDVNFFGEAILKYGSERDFLSNFSGTLPSVDASVSTYDGSLFFSGTVGAYYMNADNHITVMAQYYYNGEGQTKVSAEQVYEYYVVYADSIDRMRLGTHYAFLSFSKGEFLTEDLTANVYAISNLSDGSGMVSPSLTWQLFDYLALSVGPTFTFGPAGSEYILYGALVNGSLSSVSFTNTKPAVALNLTLTMTTEGF